MILLERMWTNMTFNRRSFRDFRLQTKLFITYIAITVIPIALLGYLAYSQYISSIERQVGTYIPRLLGQANDNIERQINEFFQMSDQIYNAPMIIEILRKDAYQTVSAMRQDEFTVDSYLSSTFIHGSQQDILGVFISSNNRLFSSTKTDYFSGFSTKEAVGLYGQNLDLRGQEMVLLPNETSLQFKDHRPFVLIAKPLVDVENRLSLGTMFIALDLSFIDRIVQPIDEQEGAEMWLMTEEGYMLYHTSADQIGRKDQKAAKYPTLNGSFKTKNMLFGMDVSKQHQWVLAHQIPLGQLTAETNFVRTITILLFIAVTAVALIIAALLAWGVAKPLQHLTEQMKRVEKGDFNVVFNRQSNDEVGMLSDRFQTMIKEIQGLIREKYQIELKQKEAEMYALQSQINPHFMYNTLETIAMTVEEDDKDTVVDMVTILGRMLRYSLSNKEKLVTIHQELQHIRDYLTIQSYRFEDELAFRIDVQVNGNKEYIPKFILQPLVENALEHAFVPGKQLVVTVLIVRDGNEIQMSVSDNGAGMSKIKLLEIRQLLTLQTDLNRDHHFGILNVNGRLVLHYGKTYMLQVDSEKNIGTTMRIRVPVNRGEQGDE
ncbi:sensor histidine kinase [Domibacillus sp. PGB-M46]|uniref:cache domain-containing sensor histidine kinase n=1 Tax=Domibacillus sp. PGB-M46 TaxID=2910255 RepID=UPI001F595CF6|nr:sensor histidine kinase [Domibacillus sp. PGB-M46]MCI2256356.1 sensor histidine kinase [Domibacillus sp. PGB-M46]